MRASRAFTLVELLMTIGVIGILAAMLLTVLSQVRSRVQAVCCLNNLQQWGNATHLYALDNDDFLPKDGTPNGTSVNEGWYIDLPRVINQPTYHEMPWRTNASIDPGRSIWICPANSRRSSGFMLFHYCLNDHVNGTGTGKRIILSGISRPVQTVWLFDNGKTNGVAQQNNVHPSLHNRGAQFVFLDGHAARFKSTEYWDSKHNKGITNNPALVWIP
jgi:prepilin-type N-terminal cleavage/methylation domain-containing protein/prepilin-type processing-associated H-X9-DG protein